ncbi:MAG: hypothetical protein ACRD2J_06240 [Thermoanaerobaculia bacterium]
MRRSTLLILAFFGLWVLGVGALSYAAYETVRHSGAIEVRIDDGQQAVHLDLPAVVPGLVIQQALFPKSWRPFHVRHGAEEWGPAVLAAMRELEAYENVPLVEIEDGRERVRIEKRGERVVIEIDSPRESVRVTMPFRMLRNALERYES